ncbi:alpha/beta hydrolase [Lactiplantibacillus sp. WILCCON 0030]|uniref:Alpha/beta hydrolase n=2 Tax=Lactiplantibacillus brownii TaxID=3069269 RepID=A0ABU1A8P6_9LACO|nr:alpha/beta hydrolase [Lactiplantibacillus brownii]MDQ7936817.1 alpha/beta hydrolase [Lactiplantibacillus brownii]
MTVLISLGLALTVGLAGCAQHVKANKYVQSTTPTLFFHGGGSSYHAEEHMADAAKQAGVTNTIIRAMVSKTGHVKLVGKLKTGAINPIVEVNYANNRELNYRKHGQWATNVVVALQKQYHFKSINMVGHSLGNISLIYYSLANAGNHKLPKLRKQVDIAGHFAGLDFKGMPASVTQPAGLKLNAAGKPNQMNATYREMTKLRQVLPKNQVKVLNIYGNIGGHTDGTVPNVASLSLKYLVTPRAKSYQEKEFTGKLARHSKLHENPQVDRTLIKFLWGK